MKRYTPKPQEQLLSLNRLREVEQKLDLIAKEFHQQKIFDPEKIVLDHFEFMALFKISRRTSQHWRIQKKIDYSLIGGRIYFTLADIQRLVQENKVRKTPNSKFQIPDPQIDLRETMGSRKGRRGYAEDAKDSNYQLTN